MDNMLFQAAAAARAPDGFPVAEKEKAGSLTRRLSELSSDYSLNWGRKYHKTWTTSLGCAGIVFLCPLLVIFTWIALDSFGGSLTRTMVALSSMGPSQFALECAPAFSLNAFLGYMGWLTFQAVLYGFLPGKLSNGQLTPAGYLLQYRTNGFLAWIFTHAAVIAASRYCNLDLAILAKNWAGLLIAANVYGFLLTGFAYIKAHVAPSHPEDRKFSGSFLYDYYMGIEFNPRFGKLWDFKLFHNGRPGIIAWTLIDLSFTAWQYQLHGYVTNSILIVDLLHAIYVVDFFINEDWYLRTIDICHDHFGFYLAWGSVVWLPSMYTLQTQYLARNPLSLSTPIAVAILCTGLGGYVIFRSVNHQKDLARRSKGKCIIWGKKAEVVRCRFKTADGVEHESLLLCSGWWGIARHANYLGDLILSYSMCATCGVSNLLPWTYAIFMTVLLLHRCERDEERCAEKYQGNWKLYTDRVRWKLVPGIY